MSKPTTSGSVLAKLFPAFFGVFSANASTEEFNKAEAEAAALEKKLAATGNTQTTAETTEPPTAEALQAQVTKLQADLAAEKKIGAEVPGLKDQVTKLKADLAAAEKDRDTYKAHYDKQKGNGKVLPTQDASTANQDPSMTDYNAHALEVFKKAH
ncbi:hypothetical protein [Tellurirhabdus rosea]|uniref:hypothetical protein n=1 Tax=Tellurirhabdus rosea TaxID=2674997 RepID=UPI0022595274|nr:hypothetical protein [Tellurirhabdus rosea]